MALRRTTARMGAEVYVRDRTRPGLQSINRGFTTTMSGMGRQGTAMSNAMAGAVSGNAMFAAAAGASAFLGFTASAVGSFIELEKKWAEVTTLMPGMQADAIKAMKADIDQFAKETGTTLADAYRATYQAVSAGVSPQDTPEFLRVAQQAALAGVTDLTSAVDGLTSALNAYGLEMRDARALSDDMFTAVRLGKTTFPELAGTLGMVMPIAASLNTEFRELTAASAALTAAGNTQAIATTQIRSALVALSKETQAKSIFEAATGMTYPEFQAAGGTLQEAMTIIVDEAERMGVSVPQAFGRIEGATAALTLAGEGALVFAQAMAETAGATEDAAKIMEDTTDFTVRRMKAEWESYKTWFGQDFVEMMGAAYGNFNDLLATFGIGMSMKEKEILSTSEENWRKYGRNIQKVQTAIQENMGRVWGLHINRQLAGGAQPGAVPGLPSGPPITQTGPTSVGAWLAGVSGLGAGGGDVWALADMNQRFNDILQGNVRETYATTSGAAGGGGGSLTAAIQENTLSVQELADLMKSGSAITVRLDAQIDEGVVLRADTVMRATRQIAGRFGNPLAERVRSG